MPHTQLRAGFVLRLTQHLSRLSFELRDLRTGHSHHFDSATELSHFLDTTVIAGAADDAPGWPRADARPPHSPGGPST